MNALSFFEPYIETQAAERETARPLRVLIAHDDRPAYLRAMRMLANTFLGQPEAHNLRSRPWRFEELEHEVWRRRATTDAAATDVFVVSTSENGDLPEEVKRWLLECFVARRGAPTAVMVLCDSLNDFAVPWRRVVRAAADATGVDFLEMAAPVELLRAS